MLDKIRSLKEAPAAEVQTEDRAIAETEVALVPAESVDAESEPEASDPNTYVFDEQFPVTYWTEASPDFPGALRLYYGPRHSKLPPPFVTISRPAAHSLGELLVAASTATKTSAEDVPESDVEANAV